MGHRYIDGELIETSAPRVEEFPSGKVETFRIHESSEMVLYSFSFFNTTGKEKVSNHSDYDFVGVSDVDGGKDTLHVTQVDTRDTVKRRGRTRRDERTKGGVKSDTVGPMGR